MKTRIDRTLIKNYILEVGKLNFYPNYVVSEIKEGVALSFKNATEIVRLTKLHYGNETPFIYIANRKNSYSFNPTAHYKTIPEFPNLKGFAAVVYSDINKDIAQLEKSFIKKPVEAFKSLESAILWAESIIITN
ncbi:hypothetical protein H0I23_15370 [Cellulophaga sp. HaHaR_3_176]|uniref:hypothetical protein n=1 Tax=Cellulophaga sp. HaHaR_3_176 TaxID=1942464 RepID=UPI001C1F2720|nr:hypothetical protein [Cellulophaga sp. HaHaR_3_176]QWX83812.1 hypothetical protein H0I23_15370 [Cellulophaga sp. HaHaR_3_176]